MTAAPDTSGPSTTLFKATATTVIHATTTTIHATSTTVGHGSGVVGGGTDVATWLIAIFTGVTALGGLGLLLVTVVIHIHDRATSGTSRAVVVQRGRQSLPWDELGVDELPAGWDHTNTRWIPVRFVNRSRSATLMWPPDFVRLGLFHRRIEAAGANVLVGDDPQQTLLLVHRVGGWSPRTRYWLTARFETGGGQSARLRRFVRLKKISSPLPPVA